MLTNAVLLSVALLSAPPEDAAKSPGKCPISGRPGDAAISLFNSGKSYNFCCKNCLKKYRDVNENKLTKVEAANEWRLLFNGKDVEQFQKPTRTAKWTVEDGVLRGSGGPGVIGTKASYDNFDFRADVRVYDTGTRRGNSGVFIRSTGLLAMRGRWPDGPEIQVDHGDKNFWTGAIWKTAKAKAVKTKDKEWFELRILAKGSTIRVWVNGELVTEHKIDAKAGKVVKGPIAFQCHHPTDVVEFKNVKVRPLSLKTKVIDKIDKNK